MFRQALFIFLCVLTILMKSLDALVPVAVGKFSMWGEEGEQIAAGQRNYSYDAAKGDNIFVSADDGRRTLHFSIENYNGDDSWSMDLQAPAGEKLVIGKYLNATRYPFYDVGPLIDISFGPNEEVDRLEITFEQHCDYNLAALRGIVVIGIPVCGGTSCSDTCDGQDGGHFYLCYFREKQIQFFYLFGFVFVFGFLLFVFYLTKHSAKSKLYRAEVLL